MDCAEVLDHIEAAVLAPGKLRGLETDPSEQGVALRQHLSTCEECSRELRAWRFADRALREATPESISASPEARTRLLAAIAEMPRAHPMADAATLVPPTMPAVPVRTVPGLAKIAVAAALAALVFVAGALFSGPLGIAPGQAPGSGREEGAAFVSAAVDRVLAQPGRRIVELQDQGGARSGTLLFDAVSRELVVFSRSLGPAPAGAEYGCFVERDGAWTRIGRMVEYEGISWWVGALDEPTDAGRSGDRFIVALEAGAATLSGAF